MAKSYEEINAEMAALAREVLHVPLTREEVWQLYNLLNGKEGYERIAARLKRGLEFMPPGSETSADPTS